MSTDFEDKYKHWHQKLSYIKSGIRLIGCFGASILIFSYAETIAMLFLIVGLILAEFIGIAEEWI